MQEVLVEFERIGAELDNVGEATNERTVMSTFLRALPRANDDIVEKFANSTVYERAATEAHVRTHY